MQACSQMAAGLNQILLEIYGAQNLVQFRERALAGVRELFGGEMVCHNELNLVDGSSLSVLSRPVEGFEALRPAFFEHVQQHPSIQHHLAANGSESEAVKTSDFVSQRQWRNTGLYRDFYRPLSDIRYQLTIGQRIDNSLIFFAISRKCLDFTEEERDILTALRPHFIQAYRNAQCHEALAKLQGRPQEAPEGSSSLKAKGHPAENQNPFVTDPRAVEFVLMRHFKLSKAEARVLRALASGLSNAAICQALFISLPTVKSHLAKIYRCLGVSNRVEAALLTSRVLQSSESVGVSTENRLLHRKSARAENRI